MIELLKLIQAELDLSDEQRDALKRFPETVLQRAYSITHVYHPGDRNKFKYYLKYFS